MELDNTAAAVLCAIGALFGYQYSSQVKAAAQRAYACCRPGNRR